MLLSNPANRTQPVMHMAKSGMAVFILLMADANGRCQEKPPPTASREVLTEKLKKWEEQLVKIRQAMFDDCDEAIKKADAVIERIAKERDEARKTGRRDLAKQITQTLRMAEEQRDELHRLRLQIEKRLDVGRQERGRRKPPQHARLGLQLVGLEPVVSSQLALPDSQGLAIQKVRDNSPAAKAGLRADDILLEIEGKPVPSQVHGFRQLIADLPPEKPWSVAILRGGKRLTITGLTLEPAGGK